MNQQPNSYRLTLLEAARSAVRDLRAELLSGEHAPRRPRRSDLISDDPVYRAAISGMDEIERGLTT